MTMTELEKEAEKGLDKRLGTYAYINKQNCHRNYVDGYIDGAESREKRIAELEKKLTEKVTLESLDVVSAKINELENNLTKAKEIILRLYNAGRDVLMCRAEEKAYKNLSNAINDKSIEQFLKETEQ